MIPLLIFLLLCGSANAVENEVQNATQSAAPTVAAARALLEQGRDADGIGMLQKVVTTSPEHYQAWFLLGVTQAKQRRFHDAITSFDRVVSLQPKLAEPHNNLAVIYNELGDFRAAVKELEASLKLKPDYVTAHENIGDLYVKLAADAYRKALEKESRPALRQRYERLLHIRDVRKPSIADEQPVPSSKHVAVAAPVPKRGSVALSPVEATMAVKAALAALESWRTAWSQRDLSAYFSAYSPEFEFSSRFKTLEQWKQYKRRVIKKRTFIQISLENIEAKELPDGGIKLVFLQHFRSDSFDSDDTKDVLLRHTQDGWKIKYEISR